MALTDTEHAAFHYLARVGALSVDHLDRAYDNHEADTFWHGLIGEGLVRIYHTIYGQVAGLTDQGRTLARAALPHVPYLAAPGSVANRAYLNDALHLLRAQGYQDSSDPPQYRQYPHSKSGRTHTDEIISCTVRIPDAAYAAVSYRPSMAPHSVLHLPYLRPGQPRLYATIANGGITPKQAKIYLKRSSFEILCWQTPLLLAVPDPAPFASLLAQQHRVGPRVFHPTLCLITVPLPNRQVQRFAERW